MTEAVDKTPPAPYFEYQQNGEDKRILMTFGLIDILAKSIGSIELVIRAGADRDVNNLIFSHVLTLDEKGRPHPDKYDAFAHPEGIALLDMQKLLAWTAGHLTDFFIGALELTAQTLEKQTGKLAAMQQRQQDLQNLPTGSKE